MDVWGRFRTARAQRQLLRCSSREHPCKPPPYRSVHDPSKIASGVLSSGPWDPWLPVVKNSRLFAQRTHSARCAPCDTDRRVNRPSAQTGGELNCFSLLYIRQSFVGEQYHGHAPVRNDRTRRSVRGLHKRSLENRRLIEVLTAIGNQRSGPCPLGPCLPGTRPSRCFCTKHPDLSFTLPPEKPPGRPESTPNPFLKDTTYAHVCKFHLLNTCHCITGCCEGGDKPDDWRISKTVFLELRRGHYGAPSICFGRKAPDKHHFWCPWDGRGDTVISSRIRRHALRTRI